jgi:hypothetical protein
VGKEKMPVASDQLPVGADARVYELLTRWRGAMGAAAGIELYENGHATDLTQRGFELAKGGRLRASTPQGQTLLEAMLAHGYVKEVS